MDNLNTKTTGLALGITSAIIYIICAATYWIWPNLVINYSNYLFHGVDITAITNKAITFGNTIIGLIIIFVSAYLIGILFAALYNSLNNTHK